MNSLSGNWEGSFTYGENYTEKVVGQSVAIKVSIDEQDGDLHGTCQDIGMEHVPAKIKGFVDEDYVSFVKVYSHYVELDENGELNIKPDEPAHEIHYSGTWDGDTIQGVFEIGDTRIFARAEAVYEGGTFIIKKQA